MRLRWDGAIADAVSAMQRSSSQARASWSKHLASARGLLRNQSFIYGRMSKRGVSATGELR
jgi:hypothetical protein